MTTVSLFQPQLVYKQAVLDQFIPYRLCSCLKTSPPLQVFISPLPAAPGCSMPRWEDFVPEVTDVPTKWPQVVTCKPACSVPDAPRVPTNRPQVAPRKSALFLPSSQLPHTPVVQLLALASLNCHLLPVPTQDWTPLWHGFGSSLWCESMLLRAHSCHLVPLY